MFIRFTQLSYPLIGIITVLTAFFSIDVTGKNACNVYNAPYNYYIPLIGIITINLFSLSIFNIFLIKLTYN